MTTRLKKEFKRLQDYDREINTIVNLQNRWLIPTNNDYKLEIEFTKLDLRNYILSVKVIFSENRINNLLHTSYIGVPTILNNIIISYLPKQDMIHLNFSITYGEKYPFIAPTWKLLSSNNTYGLAIDIPDYYKYLIDVRNQLYSRKNTWTSAITMEKDIFDFVVHINHFNHLLG